MNFSVHFAFFLALVMAWAFLPWSISFSIGVIWLCIFLYAAFRFAHFSWQRKASLFRGLGYGFVAALHFPVFLWKLQPRLELTFEEKAQLLTQSQAITCVSRPSSLLCPFCRVEIPEALAVLPNGSLGVRRRPVVCPRCQTRLDCCRFCAFFEPRRGSWGEDVTSGRCSAIKKHQDVEDICDSSVARRLKEMGWHTLYAGLAIPDSFSPPDICHTFQFDERKTLSEGLPCMGKERTILLRFEEEVHSQPSSSSRSG